MRKLDDQCSPAFKWTPMGNVHAASHTLKADMVSIREP
jgi:hypothetical protein